MATYIGTISEHNGGMEYSSDFLFNTTGNPDKKLDRIAANWRGEKLKRDGGAGGYWSEGNLIFPDGCVQVKPEHVKVLRKYMITVR